MTLPQPALPSTRHLLRALEVVGLSLAASALVLIVLALLAARAG